MNKKAILIGILAILLVAGYGMALGAYTPQYNVSQGGQDCMKPECIKARAAKAAAVRRAAPAEPTREYAGKGPSIGNAFAVKGDHNDTTPQASGLKGKAHADHGSVAITKQKMVSAHIKQGNGSVAIVNLSGGILPSSKPGSVSVKRDKDGNVEWVQSEELAYSNQNLQATNLPGGTVLVSPPAGTAPQAPGTVLQTPAGTPPPVIGGAPSTAAPAIPPGTVGTQPLKVPQAPASEINKTPKQPEVPKNVVVKEVVDWYSTVFLAVIIVIILAGCIFAALWLRNRRRNASGINP